MLLIAQQTDTIPLFYHLDLFPVKRHLFDTILKKFPSRLSYGMDEGKLNCNISPVSNNHTCMYVSSICVCVYNYIDMCVFTFV